METILISLCIAICGGVIGYIFGYRHGSGDVDRIYKDVYDIKEVQDNRGSLAQLVRALRS